MLESLTFSKVAGLAGIGLVAGLLGGLLGVGGGVIFIPGMRLLGLSQHLAQAVAMISEFFVAAPAAARHRLEGVVNRPVVTILIPTATAGVVFGVMASNLAVFRNSGAEYLAKVFAAFMVYVIGYNTYRLIRYRHRLPDFTAERAARMSRWGCGAVGLATGFASGLLGIGGGAFAVPAQQVFLRIPLKNAIGNSACTIVFSILLGAVIKNATLHAHHLTLTDSLQIAAMVTPLALVGGWLGAQLTHKLPRHPVRAVFVVMLIFAAWKMWHLKPQAAPARPAAQTDSQEAKPAEPPNSQPGGAGA